MNHKNDDYSTGHLYIAAQLGRRGCCAWKDSINTRRLIRPVRDAEAGKNSRLIQPHIMYPFEPIRVPKLLP